MERRRPEDARQTEDWGREGRRRSVGRVERNAGGGRKGWTGSSCGEGMMAVRRSCLPDVSVRQLAFSRYVVLKRVRSRN